MFVQIVGKAISEKVCSISISAEVRWTSRPFIASRIETSAIAGLKVGYESYVKLIKKLVEPKAQQKKKLAGKHATGSREYEAKEIENERRKRVQRFIVLTILFLCFVMFLFTLILLFSGILKLEHTFFKAANAA